MTASAEAETRAVRIAYVINSFEGGGAAAPVPAIAHVLRAGGAEIRVFALTRRDGRAEAGIAAAGLDPLVRDGGERDHLAALRWLDRETARWGATHLWTSLTRATLLGLWLGPRRSLPVACWQHNSFLKPANLRLLRAMQHRAALWVADSSHVAALTAARLRVEPERLATWPIFAADPQAPRPLAWQPGAPLRIGSLGRLHQAKGYDVLIEALALLRTRGFVAPVPLEITIAGEGAERQALEAAAVRAGVTLAFPGFAARPDRFLAAQHLYIQPSRREGFCIAAHEAMAAGLPIIASATGELALTVTPDCGQLVLPGDAAALADALAAMLDNPGKLAAMGRRARVKVEARYSRDSFTRAGSAALARLTSVSADDTKMLRRAGVDPLVHPRSNRRAKMSRLPRSLRNPHDEG